MAATLKIRQLATEAAAGALHGSRWLQAGLIGYELFIAAWLLSGFRPQWCRRVCVVTFSGFAGFSLSLVLSAAPSCGCFGQVRVSPWMALTLDMILVLLLWLGKPSLASANWGWRASLSGTWGSSASLCIASATAMLGLCMFAVVTVISVAGSRYAKPFAHQRPDVLEPGTWVGERFPLLEYIDIGEVLSAGSWVLVLYHHDCPKCAEAMPEYQRMGEELRDTGQATRVALIEVPPHGTLAPVATAALWHGKLSDRKEWLVATPSEVWISDGRVTAAPSQREFR